MAKKCAATAHMWRECGKIYHVFPRWIFEKHEYAENSHICGINVRNLYTLTIISISRAKSCKISIASNFPMEINYWNYNSAFPVYLIRYFCNSLRKIRNEIITLNNKISLFGCMLFDFVNKIAVMKAHYNLCFIW